jgi:hypothetical protein
MNVFSNPNLLRNIRDSGQEMVIWCNAGVSRTQGEVWYNLQGIANILLLTNMKHHYCVTFDSESGSKFAVHKPDGKTREFTKSETGLFYLKASDNLKNNVVLNTINDGNKEEMQAIGESNEPHDNKPDNNIILTPGQVATVVDKQSKYTNHTYSAVVKARQFQDAIGWSPLQKLPEIVDKKLDIKLSSDTGRHQSSQRYSWYKPRIVG